MLKVIVLVYPKIIITDNVVIAHTCHVLFNVVLPFIPNINTLFWLYVISY